MPSFTKEDKVVI